MRVYFAPMEGVTDAIYRRVHHRNFGGVDKYFTPFISPTPSMTFSRRERFDMSPEQNAGVPVVPQILAKNADCFLRLASMLRDMGYRELNLNLGCPSGTVTAKGKGSGLLRDPEALRSLLDAVYARSPLPVSIKARIGYQSPGEWPALLSLFMQYPIPELIIHPRTRGEFYQGAPHREACRLIQRDFIYNGDLFTCSAVHGLLDAFPHAAGVMLGRGLVGNPALGQEITGGKKLTPEALRSFHDDLYTEYLRFWPESAVIGRMHLMIKYLGGCFEGSEKALRMLRRAHNTEEYDAAIHFLFHECPFREEAAFRVELLVPGKETKG